MFFNSPCKFQYAFNDSEFHEGIDLNLISKSEAPLNFVVGLKDSDFDVLVSQGAYFENMEAVPK